MKCLIKNKLQLKFGENVNLLKVLVQAIHKILTTSEACTNDRFLTYKKKAVVHIFTVKDSRDLIEFDNQLLFFNH